MGLIENVKRYFQVEGQSGSNRTSFTFGNDYSFNAVIVGPSVVKGFDYKVAHIEPLDNSEKKPFLITDGLNSYLNPDVEEGPVKNTEYLGTKGMYLSEREGEFDTEDIGLLYAILERPRLIITESGDVYADEGILDGENSIHLPDNEKSLESIKKTAKEIFNSSEIKKTYRDFVKSGSSVEK